MLSRYLDPASKFDLRSVRKSQNLQIMSAPLKTPLSNPRAITQALEDPTAGNPSPNALLELFSSQCDKNNGNISSFSPKRRSADTSRKRDTPTPKQTGKRHDNTTSPLRSILNDATVFVNQITHTQPHTAVGPPDVYNDLLLLWSLMISFLRLRTALIHPLQNALAAAMPL